LRAPEISVIVVTYNSAEDLSACLGSVQLARMEATIEVIVIDNASDDDSVGVAAEHRSDYLECNERNRGFAAAVNQGLRRARGRYVLLLNPDAHLRPGAMRALADFLEAHPGAAAVGPRILDASGRVTRSCRAFPSLSTVLAHLTGLDSRFPRSRRFGAATLSAWDYASERAVDYASGAALLLRRTAVEDVGGLDEGYFLYGEELDLCWRLGRRGWAVFYTPAAAIVHAGGKSAATVPRADGAARDRGDNRLWLEPYYAAQIRFFRRHRGEVQLLAWRLLVSTTHLAAAARATARAIFTRRSHSPELRSSARLSLRIARLAWGPDRVDPRR
jgi:GT2 family glycosyltransferase